MRKLVTATLAALLMAGCGEDTKTPGGDSPESNQSSAETIDLDDKETRDKIIAEAIDVKKLQKRGEKGEELLYASNEQTPYTGWAKVQSPVSKILVLVQLKDGKDERSWSYFLKNGQKQAELNYKDGKLDGVGRSWWGNGQKQAERNYKDGKPHGLQTLWYENGQKEGEINYKDGREDGLATKWSENGQKMGERNYKDGKLISSKSWDRDGNSDLTED